MKNHLFATYICMLIKKNVQFWLVLYAQCKVCVFGHLYSSLTSEACPAAPNIVRPICQLLTLPREGRDTAWGRPASAASDNFKLDLSKYDLCMSMLIKSYPEESFSPSCVSPRHRPPYPEHSSLPPLRGIKAWDFISRWGGLPPKLPSKASPAV